MLCYTSCPLKLSLESLKIPKKSDLRDLKSKFSIFNVKLKQNKCFKKFIREALLSTLDFLINKQVAYSKIYKKSHLYFFLPNK